MPAWHPNVLVDSPDVRILLLNDHATPTGGAELIVLSLREQLRARGHDARILASTARPHGGESEADYHCLGITGQARGVTQVWNLSARRVLRRVLREFDPDVAHVRLFLSQLSPSILEPLRNRPAVFHAAWYRSICPLGTKLLPNGESCTQPVGKACLSNRCVPPYALPSVIVQSSLWRRRRGVFDAVIANSDATRRRLTEAGINVTHTIWNGVADVGERAPLGEAPLVLFAGRLVREKGADILLEAFAEVVERVPEARLVIVGSGPEAARLDRLVDEHALRAFVTLRGFLPRAQLDELARDAWVQVVPSRWEEPFGTVAAEGMMRGTPVVVSRTGGLAEFVTDRETGRQVPPSDPRALADAIAELLLDRAENDRLGRNARAFALARLNLDGFTDRFEALYGSLAR